jgi:hypothetical protein
MFHVKEAHMATCINLKKRFGDLFQIRHEAGDQAERDNGGRLRDPWLFTIPCKHGHIYPHGGDYLVASTDHRGPIANQLAALECGRVIQDGNDGVNVKFHVDDFDHVAAIMKPRRRRRLTPSQRLERAERLRDYRFRPATHDADGECTHEAAPSAAPKPS